MSSEGKPLARIAALHDSAVQPVVVVDFNEFTAKTTLADVASAITAERGLYRIDAVTAPVTGTAGIEELAQACAQELRRQGVYPETVIGYCSAATLSMHLAAELTVPDSPGPRVILVEPSWLTPDLVRADAAGIRASLDATAREDFRGELSIEPVMDWLRLALVSRLRADGLPEDDIDLCLGMLSDRYRAWFTFLLQTLNTPIPPAYGRTRSSSATTHSDSLTRIGRMNGSRQSSCRYRRAPCSTIRRLPGF